MCKVILLYTRPAQLAELVQPAKLVQPARLVQPAKLARYVSVQCASSREDPMNNIARESLLYDFYGKLLTDKKRSVMECYHEDDMSLAEIADEMGISRAAVHDSLKSAEKQLEKYEEAFGLLERYEKAGALAEEADAIISDLESKISGAGAAADARRLREIIAKLSEPGN